MNTAGRSRFVRKGTGAFLLAAATAFALGIFFFDRGLVVFNRIRSDGAAVLTSAPGLGLCFRYALLALAGLTVLSLAGGLFRSRKSGRSIGEGFTGQAWTFAPVLALAFGRFADGRAVHFILPVPLLPLLVLAVLAAVFYLNARLHYDFRVCSLLQFSDAAKRRRFAARAWGFVLVAVLLHLLTLNPFFDRYSSHMIFAGDEPKYVRMTSSLAEDGDLDLTDDFTGNDLEVAEQIRAARTAGTRAVGDYTILGRDGGLYHFHMPGISALILPAYLLDLKAYPRDIPNAQPLMFLPAKMTFTRAWLMILAVAFVLLVARFYNRMFRSRLLAAILLAAMVLATKVPEFLLQIYPETAAGICLFLGLNALFFPFSKAWANRTALVIGIGFLPWLHQRFVPIALSLYVLFLIQSRRSAKRRRDIGVVSFPLAAIGIGYAAYFYLITGNPLPWSMYSLWGTSYTRAAIFPSGFFGYIFDTRSGLLALFPVLLFALIGFYWGFKKERGTAGKLLTVILPYFCLISITPWHGIAWETTRMSLILVPLFLVFVGFTIRALSDETSVAHLLFYGATLAFLLFNQGGTYWTISLGNVLIQPHQVGYIVQSAVILALFIGILWVLDRLTPRLLGPLPFPAIGRKLRDAGRMLCRAIALPRSKKALIGLGLAVPVIYGLVYLDNWNDKTLGSTYFSGMAKVRRLPGLRLTFRDGTEPGLSKSDDGFGSLFPRDIPFELSPGQTRLSLRFGPAALLEKCPAGRYWISLEFRDAPADFNAMYLDFAGETNKVLLDPQAGTKSSSVTRLFFEDRFIAPEVVLRFAGPVSRAIKGSLRLAPIPCYVFDRRLILMPGDDYSPRPLRTIGPQSYLTLTAIARDPVSDFTFDLSLPENAVGGVERSRILSSYPLDLGKTYGRRFNIPLDFPGPVPPEDSILALSVSEGGRRLRARSVSFPAGDVIRLGLLPQFQGGQLPVREPAVAEREGHNAYVSFDRIRVEFSTTADWARVEWLNPRDVLAMRVMDVPEEEAAGWAATSEVLSLGQSAENVRAVRRLTLIADFALAAAARNRPLEFLLQRGSVNDSRLRVSRVSGEEEMLLGQIVHTDIEEGGSGLNTRFYSVDLAPLGDTAPSGTRIGLGEGKSERWEFIEGIPSSAEAACLQIEEAKGRGIGGFFLAWPGMSGESDLKLMDLLDAAASEHFRMSFYFGPTGGFDEARMAETLAVASEKFGKHPAVLKIDERPLFVVPVSGAFGLEAWNRIFAALAGRGASAAGMAAGLSQSEFDLYFDRDVGRAFLYPGPEDGNPAFVREAGYYALLRDESLAPVWVTTVPPLFKRFGRVYRLIWDLRF